MIRPAAPAAATRCVFSTNVHPPRLATAIFPLSCPASRSACLCRIAQLDFQARHVNVPLAKAGPRELYDVVVLRLGISACLREALQHRVVERHLGPDLRKQPLVLHQRLQLPPHLAQALPRAAAHAETKQHARSPSTLQPQPA